MGANTGSVLEAQYYRLKPSEARSETVYYYVNCSLSFYASSIISRMSDNVCQNS